MADIKLVIKISEEDFEIMKHNIAINNPLCPLSQEEMISKIANGIPLPKGQKLIILSEDAVKKEQTSLSFSCQKWISEVGLSNATVAIIEADKEEKK